MKKTEIKREKKQVAREYLVPRSEQKLGFEGINLEWKIAA